MDYHMSYTRLWVTFQPKLSRHGFRRGLISVMARILPVMIVTLALVNTAEATGKRQPDWLAKPAPSMTSVITDAKGGEMTLADFKGTPILVNFWTTWCAPCVDELPALDRAAKMLAADNIKIVVISIDRGGVAKAGPVLEEYGVATPFAAYDPKARLSREMGVVGLPTSFVLSADQQTSWEFVGPYEWDEPAMIERIQSLPLSN